MLVLASPIIVAVFLVMMLFAIPSVYLVTLPIIRTIELQPGYWLSAFETKRASGKRSSQVLDTLLWACNQGILDSRFRDHETVRRLERLLKRQAPSRTYPLSAAEVIFFEFRMKERGGKRSKNRSAWRAVMPRYATT